MPLRTFDGAWRPGLESQEPCQRGEPGEYAEPEVANRARAASWVKVVPIDVREPLRSDSRERDLRITEWSKDLLCLTGRRGGTTRLSREYSDLSRLLPDAREEQDADGPPRTT